MTSLLTFQQVLHSHWFFNILSNQTHLIMQVTQVVMTPPCMVVIQMGMICMQAEVVMATVNVVVVILRGSLAVGQQ